MGTERSDYRKGELANVTGDGGQIRIKIANAEGATKWLSVTYDELLAIEAILTEGATE